MYDAIIIGAGPAGCGAALTLAQAGRQVLLVERLRLPRNKSCSGVLINKTLTLLQQYFQLTPPAEVTCTPADNRGLVFTLGEGQEYRFEQPGLNIWRDKFDHWLARQAVAAGAELREGTAALDIREQGSWAEVTLRCDRVYQEQARTVILCDGAGGWLSRKLGAGPVEYIFTYQTFNQGAIGLDPHYFYAYLQPELSHYDAWFNVKDDYLILGVAVRELAAAEQYYRRFLAYMRERWQARLTRQVKAERWLMPRIKPGCPLNLGQGSVLIGGEAAWFLNPMGEGVSAGIESGHELARALLEHGPADMELARRHYGQRVEELRRYMERQWHFVGSVSPTFANMKK